MKRIIVSDKCVACGSCTLETDLLMELPNGKASVVAPGVINEERYSSFINVIKNCPVNAISVEDVEIKTNKGTASVIELKRMIDQNLKGFQFYDPSNDEYEFDEQEYKVHLSVGKYESGYEYSSYEKAEKAGFYEFERVMYSQRKTMLQSLLVSYKNKKLNKFAYLKKETGNYYHDINTAISNLLTEISILAKEITNGEIILPEDFTSFEVGPDFGYEGDFYCYKLRNIEKLDWNRSVKPASYYDTYIDIDEYDDKYKYTLYNVEEEFKEYVALELSWEISSRIYDIIKEELNQFRVLVAKMINEKVIIIKSALKACSLAIEINDDPFNSIQNDLKELMEETKKIKLGQENAYKEIDREYNWSDYRFKSESECREAAGNRLWRFYESCRNYLSTGHSPRISGDLSVKYQKQFENIINDFKNKVQAIYDKNDIKYPNVIISVTGKNQTITVDFSSFDNPSSYIDRELRDFIDSKIIGYNGVFRYSDYFDYDTDEISIWETTEWKKGFFGETEYTKYKYLLDFRAYSGYGEACAACCKYTFEDGFLQEYLNKLLEDLFSQFENEVISKIPSKLGV
ncbi:ferredoxin [Cytobacillus suaedae]|nr:ferredoxin [Cytobacillus suaedae]